MGSSAASRASRSFPCCFWEGERLRLNDGVLRLTGEEAAPLVRPAWVARRKNETIPTCVTDPSGGPVRNEPYRPRQRVLEPPPVGAGQAQYGLRGRTDEPGAGGAEAEDLASEVGLLPQESGSLAGNGGQNGSGSTQVGGGVSPSGGSVSPGGDASLRGMVLFQ